MSIYGSSCNLSSISYRMVSMRGSMSLHGVRSLLYHNGGSREKINLLSYKERKYVTPSVHRYALQRTDKIKCSIYASFGDMTDDSANVFPRIHVRDPYKRLGISREASEEEIQAARNYLISKYAGHKPSVDAIESAHDKIIMQSFLERKNPKIDLSKKAKEVTESRFVKAIISRFRAPSTEFIMKTTIAFIALGVLTVLFPTEEGPTLQVAISLILTMYFIYDRLKSRIRAFLYGFGAFFGSWLLGTFLMVSVIPQLLKGPRSLEVSTSLLSYILLWVSSTYLI